MDDSGDDSGDATELKLEIQDPSEDFLAAVPGLCKKFGSKVSITLVGLDPEGDDEEGKCVAAIECQDEDTFGEVKETPEVKAAAGDDSDEDFGDDDDDGEEGGDGDEDGDEGGDDDSEDSEDSEDSDGNGDDEDDSDDKGEELTESLQYEPNTVGAVIKILQRSDPRDYLFVRLAPDMQQCMIYDIHRKLMVDKQSTTYMEIALGAPEK